MEYKIGGNVKCCLIVRKLHLLNLKIFQLLENLFLIYTSSHVTDEFVALYLALALDQATTFVFSRNFLNVMFHFSRGMSHQCCELYWKSCHCYVQQSTFVLCGLFFFESFYSIFLGRILIYIVRMVK